MANFLQSVNWDSIGKTASQVGSAASAISQAAGSLKNLNDKKNVTTTTQPSGDGGGGVILPILAFLIFKGL